MRNLFYILFYIFWFSYSNKLEVFEKSQTNEISIKLKQYEENLRNQQLLSEAKDAKIKELEREISYLKEINKRLNISLGEFFNLQEISKIITQILDTNELLKVC